jgi:hypothetical protein
MMTLSAMLEAFGCEGSLSLYDKRKGRYGVLSPPIKGDTLDAFSQQIGAWQPFFITLAGICATLAGLLFVALSLLAASLHDACSSGLKRLAQQTFGDFLQVLFVGLFFLVPLADARFFGITTLMITAVGLREMGPRFLEAWRDRAHSQHRAYIIRRFGLSLLARAMLTLGGAWLILQHDTRPDVWEDLMLIFSGSTMLLIAAIRNAWYLLINEMG